MSNSEVSYERKLEKLGAFEISSSMLKIAKNNEKENTFLNAGRGNPNWINTESRLAFARLTEWGVEESRRTMSYGTMAGFTLEEGIADRFRLFIGRNLDDTGIFLKRAIDYCVEELDCPEDELVKELTDGIIGNNYPVPSRCLYYTERILNAYLESVLYKGTGLAKETCVFPTEGGTAAMCYIIDSLAHNGILKKGDKVAINTPIFTPYIQIPHLTGYSMVEIALKSTEESDWRIKPEEIEKLRNPEIKAFFLVNPSNPASRALHEDTLEHIAEIVKERKDLIIVTDDVYGTFVDGFKSVYSVAPHNTILVYSYSKLYGVTGWRTGMIAMNKDNVCDELIAKLPEEKLKDLDFDYSIVTLDTRTFPFVERICADSRNIGLYHTSGLSTPQQVMMALMSLTHLVCAENDRYINNSRRIVASRYRDLMESLGLEDTDDEYNAKYYSLIDIHKLAVNRYSEEFAEWMKNERGELDFLMRLAKEEGVVLMEGVGFDADPGTLRVSEANLADDSYKRIAKAILDILDRYHEEYQGI